MPRLLMLTQYFPPEMGASQTRLYELSKELTRLGWDVEILTALPNYPHGRILDGYGTCKPVRETLGPLSVIRVPLWPVQRGGLGRLVCYYSFVTSAIYWGRKLCKPPDVLFVESPPLFIGHAAILLSKYWSVPYAFNVSDLWPESAKCMGVINNGILLRLARSLEEKFYRQATLITGQAEGIVESIRRRSHGRPVELITNGVDPKRFHPDYADDEARSLLAGRDRVTFVYAGLMGLAQGLEQVLTVAERIRDLTSVQFVFIGDGPKRETLRRQIQAAKLDNVRLVPAQPMQRIPALLAAADVALAPLAFNIPGAIPSKIYEAMASGRPILLVGEGEAARRILQSGAGLVVSHRNLDDIEGAVRVLATDAALREKLGRAGRAAAETHYNRVNIAQRLNHLLLHIVHRVDTVPA